MLPGPHPELCLQIHVLASGLGYKLLGDRNAILFIIRSHSTDNSHTAGAWYFFKNEFIIK